MPFYVASPRPPIFMGPTPDEILEDLADVLDLEPLQLRRALAPLEGPEVLLRADADVGRYWREGLSATVAGGTSDVQRSVLAAHLID